MIYLAKAARPSATGKQTAARSQPAMLLRVQSYMDDSKSYYNPRDYELRQAACVMK